MMVVMAVMAVALHLDLRLRKLPRFVKWLYVNFSRGARRPLARRASGSRFESWIRAVGWALARFDFSKSRAQDDVKDWDKDEIEDGRNDHAANDRRTD